MANLTVGGIVQHGLETGLKNALSLLGAVALWALTVWIPYLNVGTTIGLMGLVAAMGKGQVISPTEIFASKYRKQMGEFFLVNAFMAIGITVGLAFLVIPGMVIAMAWGLAPLLVIDQGINPTEALQRSNDLTSGRKWTIFFGTLLTSMAAMSVVLLLTTLFGKLHFVLGALVALAGYAVATSVAMGAQAYIYGTLTGSLPQAYGRVSDSAAVGGALGAVVTSVLVVALLGAVGPSRHEPDFAARASQTRVDRADPDEAPGLNLAAAEVQEAPRPAPPPPKTRRSKR
jgi:hypothetical protein